MEMPIAKSGGENLKIIRMVYFNVVKQYVKDSMSQFHLIEVHMDEVDVTDQINVDEIFLEEEGNENREAIDYLRKRFNIPIEEEVSITDNIAN